MHLSRWRFVRATAAGFFSHHIHGGPARDLIQPGRQNGVGFQFPAFRARSVKTDWATLLGQLRRADLP